MMAERKRRPQAQARGHVPDRQPIKLALAHDWLNQIGGAEDVLECLLDCFPDSPVYTSIFAPERMPARYRNWDIRSLWIDRLPGIHARHQAFLPFFPLAWNGLSLRDFDVILSNKSGFCHGFRQAPGSLHICYCLTPTRYVWQLEEYLEGEGIGRFARAALGPLMALLRRWDYAAAQRVTHFIAISRAVQARIRRFYQRESSLIFPPVDTERFAAANTAQQEDYFLVVSRLVPYKRIDLAVRAATALGMPLKIAGAGRDRARLQALAGGTVEFLGYVPDEDLPALMAQCQALIFPGLEDFGIVPVQAQAAGRPVIAYAGGGALDTVAPGLTGEFFNELTVDSLKAVWRNFDASAYNPERARRNALQFDKRAFTARMRAFITQAREAQQAQRRFVFQDPAAASGGYDD